jgi:cysteine desulfurase
MERSVIYLDYNATTPCDPRVVDAMLPYFGQRFANPSSRSHRPGQEAALAVEDARRSVANVLGVRPAEVVFTAGATEANNMAIRGVAEVLASRGRHLVSQVTEHPSVLEPLRWLERRGWEVELLGVDRHGRVRLEELEKAVRPDTVLVSLMAANNETGTLQPVAEAARLAHAKGALLHCDAAQAVGKVVLNVEALGADLLSLSAHKFYGPKGVGALVVRRAAGVRPRPVLVGSSQEGGLRPGTLNVPGIVGLATALTLAAGGLRDEEAALAALRDGLERRLREALDGVHVHGHPVHRLPGTTNLGFEGVDGEALLASLGGLAVSPGSACASGSPEPSPVLSAMGVPADLARASFRISLGRPTTEEEVERAAELLMAAVRRLRGQG